MTASTTRPRGGQCGHRVHDFGILKPSGRLKEIVDVKVDIVDTQHHPSKFSDLTAILRGYAECGQAWGQAADMWTCCRHPPKGGDAHAMSTCHAVRLTRPCLTTMSPASAMALMPRFHRFERVDRSPSPIKPAHRWRQTPSVAPPAGNSSSMEACSVVASATLGFGVAPSGAIRQWAPDSMCQRPSCTRAAYRASSRSSHSRP